MIFVVESHFAILCINIRSQNLFTLIVNIIFGIFFIYASIQDNQFKMISKFRLYFY